MTVFVVVINSKKKWKTVHLVYETCNKEHRIKNTHHIKNPSPTVILPSVRPSVTSCVNYPSKHIQRRQLHRHQLYRVLNDDCARIRREVWNDKSRKIHRLWKRKIFVIRFARKKLLSLFCWCCCYSFSISCTYFVFSVQCPKFEIFGVI